MSATAANDPVPPPDPDSISPHAHAYGAANVRDLMRRIDALPPGDVFGREQLISLTLTRAWLAGAVFGLESAREVLTK